MIWGCRALTDRVVDSGQAVVLALQQPYSSAGSQGEPGANMSFGPGVQQVKRCVPPCDAGHQHPDKEGGPRFKVLAGPPRSDPSCPRPRTRSRRAGKRTIEDTRRGSGCWRLR
jgi:hypothetical protein